jgi:hypothetical protein
MAYKIVTVLYHLLFPDLIASRASYIDAMRRMSAPLGFGVGESFEPSAKQ